MMKKVAIGLLSFIAWVALVFAVLFTSLNLLFNGLNESGDVAASVLTKISTSDSAISSIFDEIKKSVDPKLAVEFEKKEEAIKEVITTLSASSEFKRAVASSINGVSRGLFSGANNVTIDFSETATLLVNAVNKANGTPIITKKDLSKLTLKTLDISKQSKILTQVQEKLHLGLLFWIVWVLIMLGVFFIKRGVLLKSAGWQLISLGPPLIILRLLSPLLINRVSAPAYLKEVLPQLINSLFGPVFILGAAMFILGGVILVVEKRSAGKLRQELN